ncbi:MAG: M48 family metallopeptidase [Chloroflexota bacterium]|nr:M48 family metallopeptidase [Chloroflexota bacterium]
MNEEVYDDIEERERAIRYSRIREWLTLVDLLWGMLGSILILATGTSARLRDRAERLAPGRLGPALPYALGVIPLSYLSSLPLSYLSGFVVEHRFGLSNQSPKAWFVEQLKGLGVSLLLILPIVQGAVWVIQRYRRRWWAILSGLTIPFAVILANLAPVLLMPIFNKFEPLHDLAMAERIKRLAAGQGVKVSEVLQMDMSKQTKKANAFFTGMGNTKRIVLGDTLLDEFTPDEVEVVLAHELGHQVHRDLWKLIGLQAPMTLATFYAVHRLLPAALRRFGKRFGLRADRGGTGPAGDVAVLPLMALLGSTTSLALMPLVNAINRRFVEHRADEYALALTGKREPFISAMRKLARMNLSNPKPSALIKYLFYSHPPIGERIEYGRNYQA